MTTIEFSKYILYKLNHQQYYVCFSSLNLFIYYCQAWCYTIFGIEIINELPEANVVGPRYVSLYDYYREAQTTNRCLNCKLTNKELELEKEDFNNYLTVLLLKLLDNDQEKTQTIIDLCEEIIETYSDMKISDLRSLYYREDPHSDARFNVKPLETCHNKITLELMKCYFAKQLELDRLYKEQLELDRLHKESENENN